MKVIILTSLLAVSGISAQIPKLFWDGTDWQRMGDLAREYPEFELPLKRAYVVGLLDSKYYYFLQAQALDSTLAATIFRDYLSTFGVEALIRGTDEFYRDPANVYLPVMSAMAITSLRSLGLPDSVVTDFTAASRDWINRLTSMYSHEVPIPLEGIDRPRFPRPPFIAPPPAKGWRNRRWYRPDSLVIP